MRNQRNVSLKNTVSVPASDYLQFQFHEASGSTAAYTGKLSGVAVSDTITLAGAVTNAWDDRGWLEPDVVSGSYTLIPDGTNLPFENFFRSDNLAGDGMLVLYTHKHAGTPPTGILFRYGTSGARGGWYLNLTVGANLNFELNVKEEGATAAISAKKAIAVPISGTTTVGAYISGNSTGLDTEGTARLAVNGDSAGADTDDISAITQRGLLVDDGIGIMAGSDFGATSPQSGVNIGGSSGNEHFIHGLTFIRVSGGLSVTELATILQQHADNPREIPLGLNGK